MDHKKKNNNTALLLGAGLLAFFVLKPKKTGTVIVQPLQTLTPTQYYGGNPITTATNIATGANSAIQAGKTLWDTLSSLFASSDPSTPYNSSNPVIPITTDPLIMQAPTSTSDPVWSELPEDPGGSTSFPTASWLGAMPNLRQRLIASPKGVLVMPKNGRGFIVSKGIDNTKGYTVSQETLDKILNASV